MALPVQPLPRPRPPLQRVPNVPRCASRKSWPSKKVCAFQSPRQALRSRSCSGLGQPRRPLGTPCPSVQGGVGAAVGPRSDDAPQGTLQLLRIRNRIACSGRCTGGHVGLSSGRGLGRDGGRIQAAAGAVETRESRSRSCFASGWSRGSIQALAAAAPAAAGGSAYDYEGVAWQEEFDADDDKFVELREEQPAYGPEALLLVGFTLDDENKVREALDSCGADFVSVTRCTDAILNMELWDAMHHCAGAVPFGAAASAGSSLSLSNPTQGSSISPEDDEAPPGGSISQGTWTSQGFEKAAATYGSSSAAGSASYIVLSEDVGAAEASAVAAGAATAAAGVCIMSGLTGEECVMLVDMLQQLDLDVPSVACAVMVPKSARKHVFTVVEEILGDHEESQSW